MDKLIGMLDSHFIYAMGWTLVHSLWQGLLVMFLLHLALKVTQSVKPATRYLLCLGALTCCLLLSALTFYSNYQQSTLASDNLTNIQAHVSLVYDQAFWTLLYQNINPWLNWVVIVWLVGFSYQFVRYLCAVVAGIRLTKIDTSPVNAQWYTRLNKLVERVQIEKNVVFKHSSKINVPCIVGHFKPVVLLPLGLFTQLPTEQVEAIVLHELAHIKRHDYVINLIQYLVKIIFFFNPFVLNICAKIDCERESACDDIAVKTCGDPMAFALSLSRFAEFSQHQQTVLAANKDKFLLLNRVKRLFKQSLPVSAATERLVLLLGMAVFGLTLNVNASDKLAGLDGSLSTTHSEAVSSVTGFEETTALVGATEPVSQLPDINGGQVTISQSDKPERSDLSDDSGDSATTTLHDNSVLVASSARDYQLNNSTVARREDESDAFTAQSAKSQHTDNTSTESTATEEEPLVKFNKPLTELSLVAVKDSGFDLALFETQIAKRQYRGIKILPINVDKTVVDAKFKHWESITYGGLKDSLDAINLLVKQHNAQLNGIPDQDLLVAEIDIQKVVHIKLYSGMLSHISTRYSPGVKYLVGTQIQLLVSDPQDADQMGIIWAGFALSGESPSGKNFRFWNTETQQNYWQEVIAATLSRLDNTLVQIQNHNFDEFKPERDGEYCNKKMTSIICKS